MVCKSVGSALCLTSSHDDDRTYTAHSRRKKERDFAASTSSVTVQVKYARSNQVLRACVGREICGG